MTDLMRHVAAATSLVLPGRYLALSLGGDAVGFVPPETAELLWSRGAGGRAEGCVALADKRGLARCEDILEAAGLFRRRGEAFDVRAVPGGPVLGLVDRGALPVLGIQAEGVHVNGLVRTPGGWDLWVARRARSKALDAGKLDHIVAGGICAGMDAPGTLIKEAAEEAGVPAALAATARAQGVVEYAMERQEGLRRDRLYCYDLELPADFVPKPQDGEVEGFERMPVEQVMDRVRTTDDFKFNVNLVLIALFERLGVEVK